MSIKELSQLWPEIPRKLFLDVIDTFSRSENLSVDVMVWEDDGLIGVLGCETPYPKKTPIIQTKTFVKKKKIARAIKKNQKKTLPKNLSLFEEY